MLKSIIVISKSNIFFGKLDSTMHTKEVFFAANSALKIVNF